MARAQLITYNNITMSLVYTNNVTSRAIYTSDNTTYLWTEFTIDIDCILNPNETSYILEAVGDCLIPFENPGSLPMDTFEAIRFQLMQPRQEIDFGIFGSNIIALDDPPDANNGPIPLACNIRKIVGGQVFYFNYVIKVHLLECECPPDDILGPLISNRFSQSQSINRDFYTEVTTTGEALFRTDLLINQQLTVDTFRINVLPLLPSFMHRERVRFNINSAGNSIAYEVTDVEKFYDLGDTGPNGSGTYITNFEGTYNQQTIKDEKGNILGGMQMGTITVKLWAGRPGSNWTLTQVAFAIILNSTKMSIANPLNADGKNVNIPRHLSITQDLANNYVEVTLQVQMPPVKDLQGNILAMQTAPLIVDNVLPGENGKNPNLPQNFNSAGSLEIELLSSALQDACSVPSVADPEVTEAPPTIQPTLYPPPQTQSTPNLLPPTQNKYSQPTTQYPYTYSRSDSYYNTIMGNMQLPLGAQITSPYSPPPPPPSPSQCGTGSGNPTSTVVTLSNPITTRRVVWTCERLGATPQIPSPISSDTNQVLLDMVISPVSMVVLEDGGTPAFRVNGEYIYALKADITQNPIISFDVVQWITYPYCQFSFDTTPGSNDSVHGLIDMVPQQEPV